MSAVTMDGRELFLQLADKVARGEIYITHFAANLMPSWEEKQYDINVRGEIFTRESPRAKIDMRISVAENDGRASTPPAVVAIPKQVRELIFDEEPQPIYDEDLT